MLSTKDFERDIPWLLLAIEAGLIVLSVLLALSLAGWREARANERLAVQAVQGIVDEASLNCAHVTALHPYHVQVADGDIPSEGLRIGMIRNDAWDSARATGAAAHLDYGVAAAASTLYALQRDHRATVEAYMHALFVHVAGREDVGPLHTAGEVMVVRELVRMQAELVAGYETFRRRAADRYGRRIDLAGFCEAR